MRAGFSGTAGFFGTAASGGVPLPPADPADWLEWNLRYQAPLGSPLLGVELDVTNLWVFDDTLASLTDVKGLAPLVEAGTVPGTSFGDSPETSVKSSPIMRGFRRFDGVTDALTAATSSVGDITTSALFLWCSRIPTTPGAGMSTVSKRQSAGDFIGTEDAINAQGKRITTFDFGATSSVHALNTNYTAELPNGAWHWHAFLVDAGGGASGRTMTASDMDISAWLSNPVGTLSNAIAMSLGAGRLQALPQDVSCLALFMGAQVENLFNSPSEDTTDGNDPFGANLRDQVCVQIASNTTMFPALAVSA